MAYYGYSFCDLFYYFQDIKFDDVQIMKMKGLLVTKVIQALNLKFVLIIQTNVKNVLIFTINATKFQLNSVPISDISLR